MISTLTGTRVDTGLDWVVLDVSGVGYRLQVTPNTVSDLVAKGASSPVTLFTNLIVRQDAMTLYGFMSGSERDAFDVLISVTGIGPRTALAALSVLSPNQIATAVEAEDLATLQQIPGVGKKSAQRMVLEIAGKLAPVAESGGAAPHAGQHRQEVEGALINLGWTKSAVESTLNKIDDADYPETQDLLRAALLMLGPTRA